jgi:cell fate regulator YaaT (PSP1 superfamily)
MPPVSMKMAKIQKATLDPTKISGRCGRLKCCLRYEFPVYEELQKKLPPVGAEVDTPEGKARVLAQEILAEQLLVQTADERRVLVSAGDVRVLSRRNDRKKPDGARREEPAAKEGDEALPPV